jgi:UDP-glucuronate decarboxylase
VPFDITRDDISVLKNAGSADYVIHLASVASPVFYRKYPLETLDANVWGLRKLLDYFCGRKLQGLLFFSSSEIYGDPAAAAIPTSEEYRGNVSCVGPRACYDEAKRFGETLGYVFAQTKKVPVRVVRPFNNYGPGMSLKDGRVPADFAKAVMTGKDIVIHSDGTPTRTFCYVADAIVGYLKALVYKEFDYFNIGMDAPEISMRQFAGIYQEQARALLNYSGKIVFAAAPDKDFLTHNPSRRCPDISKARRLLDFSPKFDPRQGVARFLEYLASEKK